MKIIHAADLHVDSPLRGLGRKEHLPADTIRGATRAAVENLIDLCLEEKVSLLLLAGDLLDGDRRDVHTGLFLVHQLARLRDVGTRVILIRGNHDADSRVPDAIRWPDHVYELATNDPETVRFEDLRVAVHGQGFAREAVVDNLAASYPSPVPEWLNFGLLHTNATGASAHANYAPCTVRELVDKGYDYWALGHVHAHDVLHEDPWVVYPGNLQGRHARETGAKGAVVIDADDGRIQQVRFEALDVLRWARAEVEVAGAGSLEEVRARAREELEACGAEADGRPVVARVTITGATAAHDELVAGRARIAEELEQIAAGLGDVWVEKLELGTRPAGETEEGVAAELLPLLRDEAARVRAGGDAASSLREAVDPLRAKISSPRRMGIDEESWQKRLDRALEEAVPFLRAQLRSGEESDDEAAK